MLNFLEIFDPQNNLNIIILRNVKNLITPNHLKFEQSEPFTNFITQGTEKFHHSGRFTISSLRMLQNFITQDT